MIMKIDIVHEGQPTQAKIIENRQQNTDSNTTEKDRKNPVIL